MWRGITVVEPDDLLASIMHSGLHTLTRPGYGSPPSVPYTRRQRFQGQPAHGEHAISNAVDGGGHAVTAC